MPWFPQKAEQSKDSLSGTKHNSLSVDGADGSDEGGGGEQNFPQPADMQPKYPTQDTNQIGLVGCIINIYMPRK